MNKREQKVVWLIANRKLWAFQFIDGEDLPGLKERICQALKAAGLVAEKTRCEELGLRSRMKEAIERMKQEA